MGAPRSRFWLSIPPRRPREHRPDNGNQPCVRLRDLFGEMEEPYILLLLSLLLLLLLLVVVVDDQYYIYIYIEREIDTMYMSSIHFMCNQGHRFARP